jgi:3-oxoacyl-[acyl-carrier protein] reductase
MISKELKSKAGKQKAAQIPTGRITRPDEIAAGVLYLASDAAASVTGHTLNINGGLLMS